MTGFFGNEQKRITEDDRAFTRYIERAQRIGKSDCDLARHADTTKDIIAGRESSSWNEEAQKLQPAN
ncbi:hypothetical protein [Methanolacinia petrolearia]|uniref:hypothetical protein n=1 Tax=Methanolacinia petrolearia TaxID=54120 RepID=UPI003BAA1F8F